MKTLTKKINGKFYNKCLTHFRKQFKIDQLTKVYINSDKQVYAGEWITNDVINFNSGFAPDVYITINFN